MTKKFVDDFIDHKEDDIEKIQTKPHMYISYTGPRGVLHLAKEVINNMIDECINPESPGNTIDIHLDTIENKLTVSDNGRGIPFEKNGSGKIPMELACTKLQSSSKFTRSSNTGSAGENGIGLTAVNALSEQFEMISKRYGQKATIRFENGKLIQPVKVKKIDSDAHGTTQIYKPSPMYMGANCQIDLEALLDWVEKTVYMLPHHVQINFSAKRPGKEAILNKKFKNKNGMSDYLKKLSSKPITDSVHFTDSLTATELVTMTDKADPYQEEVKRFIGLEVAFTFNNKPGEPVMDSFCNFVNTVDGGTHLDTVRNTITQFLAKQTREALSDRDAKKLEVSTADALSGLSLAVYLNTTFNPQFASQTKEKVSSLEIVKPIRDMTNAALNEYFKKNPKELKKFTDYVRMNAKARYEANKARNSVVKKTLNNLDQHKIKGFNPAIARGKNAYRELLLIEGDSAQGAVDQGRYNEFQASFGLRGVPLNTFNGSLDKALANEEFKALVQILKCNIGERFDIDKCDYNKIIIMTDSDVDGSRIFSLVSAFFIKHMPKIVEEGMLYKAVAPLYRIKDKNRPFILNKKEYIEVFESNIGSNIRLQDLSTEKVMSSKDFREFLFVNRVYLDELTRVSTHFAVDRDVIETVVASIPSFNEGEKIQPEQLKSIKAAVKLRFPEIEVDNFGVLSGVYQGRFQILTIDHLFFRRVASLHLLMHKYNGGKLAYRVLEKSGKGYDDRGALTIGQLMELCQKFRPKIITRYKGLGELNPENLSETTLNPANRILIQLTLKDLEEEMKKFSVLHGDSSGAERKELMAHFKIDREDLDN